MLIMLKVFTFISLYDNLNDSCSEVISWIFILECESKDVSLANGLTTSVFDGRLRRREVALMILVSVL